MVLIPWVNLSLLSSAWVYAYILPNDGPVQKAIVSITHESSAEPSCLRLNPEVENGTLIDQLWRNNCDLVEQFLGNAFSVAQAEQTSTGTFTSFHYYSVQDYYYLLETVLHKPYLTETNPPMSEPSLRSSIPAVIDSTNKSFQDAENFRRSLINDLEISEDIIKNGTFHAAGLGYVKWLQENINLGWFAYQVSRIPCIYGWAELAKSLNNRQDVDHSSIFYQEWIVNNLDWNYGASHSQKLQKAVDRYNNSETFEVYNRLF
ncbi:uncharacterized protein F4822DRAFT_291359 [Hypoxylon trugodes]|uniref:uncharacterized protein n=1 Tax=Hypoxylon trugodes TaxID=326681 RepID=UPI002196A1EE|nr:uncharacterized protein F4822DRAFT_291359 [Hypoxylon trugodes]KAI1387740.1 hypothetical protein F4822DRAFT_291359 [Hypoxylon trugodes]